MKLTELLKEQEILLQVLWGEHVIEFQTDVIEKVGDGILVNAIIYNDKPLEFNINVDSKIICNVFTDDPGTNKRISWKNIDVKTQKKGEAVVYHLKTNGFNSVAKLDDRRKEDRMKIQQQAQLYNEKSSSLIDITIYDISDLGISFYAPASYRPESNKFTVLFSDNVGEQFFAMKIECIAARTRDEDGRIFYGCKIVKESKDYLLYGCLKRLEKKKKDTNVNSDSE